MAKGKNTAKVEATAEATEIKHPTDAQMRKDGMESLSSRIRHLAGLGMSCAAIAKVVKRANGENPRYQHVRNVLNTPLKRATSGEKE